MLARFRDAEGNERWVDVEVSQKNIIKEEGQRVVFISEVKGATVEEASDPSEMRGDLGVMKIELEGMFEEAQRRAKGDGKPAVSRKAFVSKMTRLLGKDGWEVAALLEELRLAGDYIENGGMIYRV